MSDERPWEDYPDPLARAQPVVAAPAAPAANVGYGEDITKGAAGGLGRGVAGTIGLPGSVGSLVHAGLSKAGVPEEYIKRGSTAASYVPGLRMFTGPAGPDVQRDIEKVTGKFYEPKTVPGQYASTVAEFAPSAAIPGGGGLAARAVNTVVPALASETAGQFTKGTAAEPYARAVAGLAAGPAAAKAITPTAPASAARQAAVKTLEGEGIPLSAGQRTGSKPLQYLESNAADMPFSGQRAAEMQASQASAFDRAVTKKLFDASKLPEGVSLPDPRAVVAGKQSIADEYKRLTSGNQLKADPALIKDIYDAEAKYYKNNVLPSQQTANVRKIRDDIASTMIAGQGKMEGDVYQATRSRFGKLAKKTTDTELSTALSDMKRALDSAMERSLSPADAAAWKLNNQRYGNMKQLEPAVVGENLSPMLVAQTAKAGRSGQYAAQQSDLDRLARAASMVMKPLPNSGTAARTGMQKLFNVPNVLATGGGGTGMLLGGPVGAAVGAAAPFVASRLALSRPGQAYLGNQLMPQNVRDVVAQAMAQQAISQPGGIERNKAARDAAERKRIENRRRQGLQ